MAYLNQHLKVCIERQPENFAKKPTKLNKVTAESLDIFMESDFKDEHEMKNVRQKLSSVMRKLRSETILRKEAEEQSKKLQREKLVS